MDTQREPRRSGFWLTISLAFAAFAMAVAAHGVPLLMTLGFIKPLQLSLSTQTTLSLLLYGSLVPSIGVWLYTRIARHNDVRWFSGGNILFGTSVYLAAAVIANHHNRPAMVCAALDPLFWIVTHWASIVAVLLLLAGVIGVTWALRHTTHATLKTSETHK